MRALIVVDMQNDYLYESRKKKFSYDTKALTESVNALIHEYHDRGDDVIYIRHIFSTYTICISRRNIKFL